MTCLFPLSPPLSSQAARCRMGWGSGMGRPLYSHTSTWRSTLCWLGSTRWSACRVNRKPECQSSHRQRGLFTTVSSLPCRRLQHSHGVELNHSRAWVVKAFKLGAPAASTWIVGFPQVEMAVGQQAAAKQWDTRSLVLVLQVGNTER